MKKVISLILLISILFTMFAGVNVKSAAVTNLTQAQAVEWIKARKAEKWAINYDGSSYALPQCVDLIAFYFDTLVGRHFGLNAKDYIGRTDLPEGWTYTSTPEPGDIAVWDAWGDKGIDENGHVALVEAVGNTTFSYVHVNGNTGKSGSGEWSLATPKTYIHPDFKCATHTWDSGVVTTNATCTSDGVKTYTCTVCGETKTETIKGGHKYETVFTIKATSFANGEVGKKCTVCNKAVKTTIYRPKTAESNKLIVTYNGKYQEPGVTVKDTQENVIPSDYYTLSYQNNKDIGDAIINITFKELYQCSKKAVFMIVPKGTSLMAVKAAGASSIKVYWHKQTKKTSGYQIQYSTSPKFAKNNKSFTTKTNVAGKTVKNLKADTTYYFRIRTYKKKAGFPYYSGWSQVKHAKTAKLNPKGTSLKKVKVAGTSSIKVYWNRQTKNTSGYQIQYSTSPEFEKNNKSFTAKPKVTGKTVKKLKAGTTYYFRIRTYRKVKGKVYFSGWSKTLSAKTATPPPTWVKPLSTLGYMLFADKVDKNYFCFEWDSTSQDGDYYLHKYTSTEDEPTKVWFDSKRFTDFQSYWQINDFVTDGKDVFYVKTSYGRNSVDGIYRLRSNGENSKVFNAKGLSNIAGIYGGNIYYFKEIYSGRKSKYNGIVSATYFCKYNMKTKKTSIINKKDYVYCEHANGRYMVLSGVKTKSQIGQLNTKIALYDAKTNKFYLITKSGTQAKLIGGKLYYFKEIYNKSGSLTSTKLICSSLNGKKKKTIAKISSAYRLYCMGKGSAYFTKPKENVTMNYYAFKYKTKEMTKINFLGRRVIDIQ